MANFEKRDLLLHFDEETGEIIFYTVDSEAVAEIRTREFDGARSDIKELQDQTADEAEKALGSTIFSLFDAFSNKKIGIRDYETLNKDAHLEYVAELENRVESKDPEALYYLFIQRHHEAMQEYSRVKLEEAESLLRESAELGYEESRSRLKNDWQSLREAALGRIARRKNT